MAWQSTTSTSSCESGSEGLASTIRHDRNCLRHRRFDAARSLKRADGPVKLTVHAESAGRTSSLSYSLFVRLEDLPAVFAAVGALIVSHEIRVAVRASQFEVPVVGRQPRVEHFHDGDATISENQRAWRLLAAVARMTLDANAKQLPLSHRIIGRR